jgi:hypothetical protein
MLRRSHSLLHVNQQDRLTEVQLFLNHANTANGGLEQYYAESKLQTAKEEHEVERTKPSTTETMNTSSKKQQQGVGFLIDGIPLILWSGIPTTACPAFLIF